MAFKRSAVRSRLSPPKQRADAKHRFFVLLKYERDRTACRGTRHMLCERYTYGLRNLSAQSPVLLPLISTKTKGRCKASVFCFAEIRKRSNRLPRHAAYALRKVHVRFTESIGAKPGSAPAYLHQGKRKGAVAFRCDSLEWLRRKRSHSKFRRNLWRDFPIFCPFRAKMAASADKGKLAEVLHF